MSGGIDFPGYSPTPETQRLPVQSFDPGKGAWTETADFDEEPAATAVTCVTFNTWFQGEEKELRYGGLLGVLRNSDADVILLQETTMLLLETLLAADWVRARYRYVRSPFRADAIPSHGTMLLSRFPILNARLHRIPTHMGRNLLTAETSINGRQLVFATAHLESMKAHADTRAEQLRAIFKILDGVRDAIFAGDFNFCSSSAEENELIDPRYIDMWPALRPKEPGFTQDTDINRMLAKAKGEARKVRIDRMLLRSDAAFWRPASVRLLGTEPVSSRHSRIFPSDHFGILGTIRSLGAG